jgi:hypothetical protein
MQLRFVFSKSLVKKGAPVLVWLSDNERRTVFSPEMANMLQRGLVICKVELKNNSKEINLKKLNEVLVSSLNHLTQNSDFLLSKLVAFADGPIAGLLLTNAMVKNPYLF